MARFEIRHNQFAISGGAARPTSDMLLVAAAAGMFAPEARKGQLFIITEAEGEQGRGREMGHLAIRTIRKAFYEDTSFSVTASLRKAIITANKALYQHNFNAPSQKRGLVGVTCVVIKGADLYVARIAPGQLIICSEGRLRAIPPSPTLDTTAALPSQLIRMSALGASLTVEPEFARAVLHAGDMILIGTSNLAGCLDRNSALRVLRMADPQSATAELATIGQTHGLADAYGLVLGAFAPLSPIAQAAPLSRIGLLGRAQITVGVGYDLLQRATGELVLVLRGPMERIRRRRTESRTGQTEYESQWMRTFPEQPNHSPDPPPMPRPLEIGESLGDRMEQRQEPRVPQRDLRALPPSAALGEPGYGSPMSTERQIGLGESIRPVAQRTTQPVVAAFRSDRVGTLARINGFLTRANRERRMRNLPQRSSQQPRRSPGLSYRREGPTFPWLRLLVLVSLVAILLLYGVTLSNQNQIREVDTGLAQAEQAVAQIYNASDESSARVRLKAADQSIADLLATGTITATAEGRQRFEALQREYNRALTTIDKISYFDTVDVFARNPQPGARFDSLIIPPAPVGITDTTAFASAYILDANTGILYSQSKTGGTTQPILQPQDRFGPLNVGRVLGATWRFDTIVAVTQSTDGGPYNFYFRNGNAWSYSLLAGSEEWGRPGDHFRIANYEGNLYVWGADPGNVLRYRSGEYGSFPEPWIKNDGGKRYERSLDLAVDGKLYLLQPDGRVLVFASNDAGERSFEREITPKGIEPPVTTVTRFFVTGQPEEGFIFLVDGYNNRIIQIDKITGEFIQQIKVRPDSPHPLDYLVNVSVDTSAGRPILYLVNGSEILRAPLPDRPRPFREALSGATPVPVPTSVP